MKEDLTVTVIIPVYNVEAFLSECIESVLKQDFTDWEMLLVDDGSIDASGEICDAWAQKDSRITVIHKSNGGLSSARNTGLSSSKGKYVIFLDSDDFWITTDCLGNLVGTAEQFGADVVRGEYKEVNEVGQDLLVKDRSDKAQLRLHLMSSAEFYKSIIDTENFSVLFLFNKDTVFKSDMFFDETRCFQEDIELNIRLFCNDLRCVYVPDVFYAYRKRGNSIVTSRNISNLRDSFLLSDIFEKYSHIVTDPLLKQVYRENAVLMYYRTLVTLAEDAYFAQRKQIIKQLNLVERRKKILKWAHKYNVIRKSYLFNVLNPNISVILFRLRYLHKIL